LKAQAEAFASAALMFPFRSRGAAQAGGGGDARHRAHHHDAEVTPIARIFPLLIYGVAAETAEFGWRRIMAATP